VFQIAIPNDNALSCKGMKKAGECEEMWRPKNGPKSIRM